MMYQKANFEGRTNYQIITLTTFLNTNINNDNSIINRNHSRIPQTLH